MPKYILDERDLDTLATKGYVDDKLKDVDLSVPDSMPGPQGPKGEKGDPGPQGPQGEKGQDGYTPVKGTDYWTPSDKQEIIDAVLMALPAAEGGSF